MIIMYMMAPCRVTFATKGWHDNKTLQFPMKNKRTRKFPVHTGASTFKRPAPTASAREFLAQRQDLCSSRTRADGSDRIAHFSRLVRVRQHDRDFALLLVLQSFADPQEVPTSVQSPLTHATRFRTLSIAHVTVLWCKRVPG